MPAIEFLDDRLHVTISTDDDNPHLALLDLQTGHQWGPVPLLALEIHNKALRRSRAPRALRVQSVVHLERGVRLGLASAHESLSIALQVYLHDQQLCIRLNPNDVNEGDPDVFRLFAVDILPGLMTVGADGTLLLPVNTGVLCRPANKPERSDAFLIYGEQPRWELTPTYPLCAAWTAGAGLSVFVPQGDCDAECRVRTDGAGNGSTGFAFTLRRHWPDPVDPETRELCLAPFTPAKDDPIRHAAQRVRQHITGHWGKPTLEQRAEECGDVAYLLNAYIVKLFHGVLNNGAMMFNYTGDIPKGELVNLMTFAEATAGLKQLHQAGIDRVVTQSVGWNTLGHDGLYPTRFPIEPAFGGEEAFRQMIATGNALGYHMNVHDNFMMNTPKSPDWNAEYVIQDIHGEPLMNGCWAAGPEYATWPNALPDERLEGHMAKMKTFGIRGMYYLDYMQHPLEVNYHPQHGGPRRAYACGQASVLEKAKEVFGSVGTEFGFLHSAVAADHLCTGGEPAHMRRIDPTWPIADLIDQTVPVWQMAMSGLAIIEARDGVTWANACEAVLFGNHPRDEWSVRPGVMPVLDQERVNRIKAIYDLCLGRFGYLQLLEIVGYDEPAEGMRTTTFADGTSVCVDSNTETLLVNDEPVERPSVLI